MTKQDQVRITNVISASEARIERIYTGAEKAAALDVLDKVTHDFIKTLSEQHPRFDEGWFSKYARPIKNANLCRAILTKLGQS